MRVFVNDAGEFGNELGIIPSSDASRGREQEIAAELGFSETVFLEGIPDGVATIRIFTPASELPFAGHPSVGTAWWLANRGTPVTVLRETAGDVAVRTTGGATWIAGKAEWAPAFRWVSVSAPSDVDAADADAVETGPDYVYAWIDESAGTLRSRMFAPVLGVPEDEATGAAAVAITALLGRNLDIHQGRGSRIATRQLEDGYVEIGGRTVFDRSITL